MSAFQIGEHYTRREINDRIGGEIVHGLPRSDGQIVCACLTPPDNPGAPETILVSKHGQTEERGRMLKSQKGPIPVFIKDDVSKWRYVGDYRVDRATTDPDKVQRYEKRNVPDRDNDVAFLLHMKPEMTN